MAGKTAYQKIVDFHLLETLDDGRQVLRLDRVWGHEITTPNAILEMQARDCDAVFDPNAIKLMIDHVSPAKDTPSATQGQILRQWATKHKIEFLDVGRNGICHAVIPEKGWVLPGEIGIMGDSHTCTHGAFGSLAIGVGTTELMQGLMTGLVVLKPQKVIRVDFVGELPLGIFAKDLILWLIHRIGVAGATDAVLEFGGPVVEKLSMDGRMTLTNMAVEAGATTGMVAVDDETMRYLRPILLPESFSPTHFFGWSSDPDATYNERIEIDVSELVPAITVGDKPSQVVPASTLDTAVDQVFIGACTNGRIEDLRAAARVFQYCGHPVKEGTRCIVVPATAEVWLQADREGLLGTFMEAGCCVSNPSCAACLGMSCGVLAPGEVCVSTSNRNFAGRMGQGGLVHLTSPAVAAMTAMEGKVAVPPGEVFDPSSMQTSRLFQAVPTNWQPVASARPDYGALAAKIIGRPKQFGGRVFHLGKDDVNTDDIIPAQYLTLTDRSVFGEHCLEGKLSVEEQAQLHQSQVLIAGRNFGCGSSREHAPWALEAAGITCVIAPSFARIFRSNMFANGLLCVELSERDIRALVDIHHKDSEQEMTINWHPNATRPYVAFAGWYTYFTLTDYESELINAGGSTGVILQLAVNLQEGGKL